MKKRILPLLLALCMTLSLLPTALAASDLDTAVEIVSENIEKIPLTNDTTEDDLARALTALLPAGNQIEITIEFVFHTNASTEKEGSIMCNWSLYDPTYHYNRSKETVMLTIPIAGRDSGEEAGMQEDMDAIAAAFADYFATVRVDESNILQQKRNLQDIMDRTVRHCTEAKFLNGSGFSTSLKDGYIHATYRLVLGGQTREVEIHAAINADGSVSLDGKPSFGAAAVYLNDPRCVNIGVKEAEWKFRTGEKFVLMVCTSGCGWCIQMKKGVPATLSAAGYSIFPIIDDDSELMFHWNFTERNSLDTPYMVLVNGKDDVEVISSVRTQEALAAVLERAKGKGIPSADGTIVPPSQTATTPAGPETPLSDFASMTDVSGSKSLPKLSQTEMAALIEAAPNTLSEYPFEVEPSVKAPYATGKVKTSALQAAADRVTMLRRLAGLPAVELDLSLSEQAQYGAVLMTASEFSHYPPQPSDMDDDFYQKGYDATSTSNIHTSYSMGFAITNESYVLAKSADGFMDDSDDSNVDRVGHRRWQLNPTLKKIGFGIATEESSDWAGYFQQYVTEKVFDKSGPAVDYDFIAWPASGNFPNNLGAFDENTAWSVTVNPSRYATPNKSDLTVTMTRAADGKTWTFAGSDYYFVGDSGKYFNVDTQYIGEPNCIIFRPDGITEYEGLYAVEIKGLTDSSGKPATLEYTVNFFDSRNPQDEAATPIGSTVSRPETTTPAETPTTPTVPAAPAIPSTGTAYPSTQTVDLDGKKVEFQMYALRDENGNPTNYVKVRDLALALNGTQAQFAVGWDGAVNLVHGTAYAPNGSENSTPFSGERTYAVPTSPTNVNGSASDLQAIVLTDDDGGGFTYYQLRDLGRKLGFNVGWSAEKGVFIETDRPYSGS